eukprot:TRINITY_DN25768_c0_g1_i1.p1 TRINITY_DN25768_c0_g1~~TRINITY_DN25768_c0_g1_i1.p1  ORF type:complete len:468 (-),score=83.64 TRINITY_DN25768_c0_g1_i1:112-1488(-)
MAATVSASELLPLPQRAGLWSHAEVLSAASASLSAEETYEAELAAKALSVAELLRPLTRGGRLSSALLSVPGLEVKRSPCKHFRARTGLAVGSPPSAAGVAVAAASSTGGGLFRLVPKEEGGFQLVASIPTETLLPAVGAAMPALAQLLGDPKELGIGENLAQGLRTVRLHGTLGGSPPQLLACLIYGPGSTTRPNEEELQQFRVVLTSLLTTAGFPVELVMMASAKGYQCCVPTGRNYVDEALELAHRGTLYYRQIFEQFSNPNPHIAIATGEWLLDVVREEVNAESGGEPVTDLLELYCGAGSHTLVLAPMFRHVLAVEINRHLVSAAKHNVTGNGLKNVTVLRAPSEDFCKTIIKERSYELTGEDASHKTPMQLHFGCTVVDPPRAGLDPVTLEAVSGYDHVLYISCNPQALCNNLDVLLDSHEVRRMVLLDHFPCSAHIEMAVHLRRRRSEEKQ